ncbi:MAG: hypothetical protein ABUL52_00105, partial [Solimonas sp.]
MKFVLAAATAAVALSFAMPAFAKGADCPPLGHLPTYKYDGDTVTKDFDHYDFKVAKGDSSTTTTVSGKSCVAYYAPKDGTDPLSDLEIQTNYRDQLSKLGAQITSQDDNNTYAKLAKDGAETWFYIYSQSTSIELHVVQKGAVKQSLTAPGAGDYRLLGHMPNYQADPMQKKNFDKANFAVSDGKGGNHDVEVMGTYYHIDYALKGGAQVSGDDEIQANYRTALKALNAQVLSQDAQNTVARIDNNGQAIWVRIYSQETSLELTVVEEKALQLLIQPPTADAMKTALDKAGHLALYINFDFNKATLRPDAAPVIAQVVALLKKDPALKVSLQGHTDNSGGHD